MSCASPIINDSAFAFSSIFCVKIPFSNFESPLGPIFQDKIVKILIDGIKLGYLYWSMAKVGKGHAALNRYLIISGFGFFLLFTSNQAILMSIAPYPPFGIATITAIGLSAYLIVIGIYMSTISLSQDAELRRYIKQIARSQSRLFDSMVTAEIEREIEKRVMQVIRTQSVEMEKETGVQPSLNDQEIQDYLKQVIKEVKR